MKSPLTGASSHRSALSLGLAALAFGFGSLARAEDDPGARDAEADAAAGDSETTGEEASTAEAVETASPSDAAPSFVHEEFLSPLRVLVGTRIISRNFAYTDLYDSDVSGYRYPGFAPPMPRIDVRWYPGAHFTDSWLAHLGLVGGYERVIGASLSLAGPDGTQPIPVQQDHDRWYVGARARVPFGPMVLGAQVDYGAHTVALHGDELGAQQLPAFPDVSYQQLGLGLDVEFRIEQLILGGHASLRIVSDPGPIGYRVNPAPAPPWPWFPGTSAVGSYFGGYVGWRLSRVFDILAGVDMLAYGLDFGLSRDTPGLTEEITSETVIAGGATDRYLSVWLGLAIKLPAQHGAAPAATAGSAPAGGGGAGEAQDDFFD